MIKILKLLTKLSQCKRVIYHSNIGKLPPYFSFHKYTLWQYSLCFYLTLHPPTHPLLIQTKKGRYLLHFFPRYSYLNMGTSARESRIQTWGHLFPSKHVSATNSKARGLSSLSNTNFAQREGIVIHHLKMLSHKEYIWK